MALGDVATSVTVFSPAVVQGNLRQRWSLSLTLGNHGGAVTTASSLSFTALVAVLRKRCQQVGGCLGMLTRGGCDIPTCWVAVVAFISTSTLIVVSFAVALF